VRHGRSPVQVVVSDTGGGWLLDVSDMATDQPPSPAVDRDPATGGLGLYLVARLGAAHGWIVDGDCKHVWVRIDYANDDADAPRPAAPQPGDSTEEAARSELTAHQGTGLPRRPRTAIESPIAARVATVPEVRIPLRSDQRSKTAIGAS
jgi:hypothetical protein